MTELTVQGLHKAFGSHPVLAGLDLTVAAGSLTAILGPSGSGKTTLLRVLAGFDQADAGMVRIGGTVVDGPGTHVPPERRRIGYVPQEGSLFPHLTVAANVGFGLPARERRGPRVTALLESVGLAGLGSRYPHQLSGGQQQRVALARALAIEPAIVLLDEPFASLDARLRAAVRADVQAIFRAAGTTAILVTHDQDEALSMADTVAVLRAGQIAQCAPPQDLYIRPADPQLARFIGDANLLDGELELPATATTTASGVTTGAGGAAASHAAAGAGAVAESGSAAGPGAGAEAGREARAPRVRTMFGWLPLAAATAGTELTPGPVTVLIRPEQLAIQPWPALNSSSPADHSSSPAGYGPGAAGDGSGSAANGSGSAGSSRGGRQGDGGVTGNGAAAGDDQAGVPGRVVACEYYGHDAVIRVRPAVSEPATAGGVTELIVRTAGGPQLTPGAQVLVRARGPVLAWPR